MNNPALYTRVNGIQRSEANQLLKEFGGVFNWRSDGKDSLMDIGCGSGDIVFDYILPMLPENFERLIGADLSEKMLLHAQQQYPHPKIFFERFDLGVDARIQSLKYVQPVDHITSFYCLHWVPNQKQAMQNIYNLLKPNGDCLLVFGTYAVLYEAYEEMAETSKWGKYMSDVNRFISPYQHSHDPEKEFGQLLNDCHFSGYRLELRKKNFAFDSKEAIKNFLIALNPFYERIPLEDRDAYFDDLIKSVLKLNSSRSYDVHDKTSSTNLRILFNCIVAYIKK